MNNRSIAFQLSLYILAAVTIMVSVIVYLNYNFSKQLLMQKIQENAVSQSAKVTKSITFYVISTQEISRNISHQIQFYEEHGNLENFLIDLLHNNPILSGVRLEMHHKGEKKYLSIFSKGDSVMVFHDQKRCQFPGFELTKKSASSNEGVWSDPFFCPLDTTVLVSSFTQVLPKNDVFEGFISCQINLNFMNQLIANLDIEKGGKSFILSHDGTFLAHPYKEWIMKKNIFEIEDRIFPEKRLDYEAMIRSHQQGSGFAFPQVFGYERAWFHFSPVPYTYWTVVIIIPAKQLFLELDMLLQKILFISFAGLLFIVIIIFLIFKRMLSPLATIAKSIKRISSGELFSNNQKNEIELLSSSLNDLQESFAKQINEQNQNKKDRRKIEKDLKSAKEIQHAIIPASFKSQKRTNDIDLYATLHPAEIIGGDLYDYFYIDDNHLLFTIGDVSGKGIPAALFMAVAHTMIKSKAYGIEASKIVELVNNELSIQNTNQNFLTMFLGILNIETGELSYCNAAHNYPYIISSKNEIKALDKTHGLPIGVYSSKAYSGDRGFLRPGDRLVLYTDGVTDCRNENGELFGTENLSNCIQKLPHLSAKDSTRYILDCIKEFQGNADQADDLSLMVLGYKTK